PHATSRVSAEGPGGSIREAQRLVAIGPPREAGADSGLEGRWLRQFPASQAVDHALTTLLPSPSPVERGRRAGPQNRGQSAISFRFVRRRIRRLGEIAL